MRAAKYLNVAPWELEAQPIYWTNWALTAEAAENEAEAHRAEQAAKQAKRKR